MPITQPQFEPRAVHHVETAVPTLAIVGATGAVGVELLRCLENRNFPLRGLKLLASARSAGKVLRFKGRGIVVEELTETSFQDIDIALFSAGSDISKHFAPLAVQTGAIVVNSSAWRMDPDVPLLVPEVNAGALARHRGIVANPNCVAAILTLVLAPLHEKHPIQRISVSTYQAASGAGAAAMRELKNPPSPFCAVRP